MTNVKQVLLAATALTMLGSAAWAADGNKAYTKQEGSANSMSVVQSGSFNQSGLSKEPGGQLDQSGTGNKLTITQSGYKGEIGTYGSGGQSVDGAGAGVDQFGRYNTATVDQSGNYNYVGNILQNTFSLQNGSVGNEATIKQGGSSNRLNYVIQHYDGKGGKNSASITYTDHASDNGNGDLVGGSRADMTGAGSNLFDNGVSQRGSDNKVGLTITGDANRFAVRQDGSANSAEKLQIDGYKNQLGINQSGSGNVASVGVIAAGSDYNDIGIRQKGEKNSSTVNITGDSNLVATYQEGTNSSFVKILGSDNLLNVSQTGWGGAGWSGYNNNVNVDINGSGNNKAGHFLGDTPKAMATLSASDLRAGDIVQKGWDNDVHLTVNSNDNDFATLQKGNKNQITGTIGGGTGNAAVVAQLSDNNVATFSQNGFGNDVSIVQGGLN